MVALLGSLYPRFELGILAKATAAEKRAHADQHREYDHRRLDHEPPTAGFVMQHDSRIVEN